MMDIEKEEPVLICLNCGTEIKLNKTEKTVVCSNCGSIYAVSKLLNISAQEIVERNVQEDVAIEHMQDKNQIEQKYPIQKKSLAFKTIDGKKKGVGKIITLLVALFCICAFFLYRGYMINNEKGVLIDWKTIEFKDILPKPNSTYGEVCLNSNKRLQIYLYHISQEKYLSYRDDCQHKGFDIDIKNEDISYQAYNVKGYHLELRFYKDSQEMLINLEAPIQMKTIKWPMSIITKQLPAPKSKKGSIFYDDAKSALVYIGETSLSEYQDYVELCMEQGFDGDCYRTQDHYIAQNQEGYELRIDYLGFRTMKISISAPKKEDSLLNKLD